MDLAEYGKLLWDAILGNKEPEIAFCPTCNYKLQWIRIDKWTSYWGCMKCRLIYFTEINGCKVNHKYEGVPMKK